VSSDCRRAIIICISRAALEARSPVDRGMGSQVIQKLKQHEAELRAAGIVHLHLHGSYARGTQIEPSSDVDLIADFDSAKRLTLLDLVPAHTTTLP
jgi:tRNA nucleotidyltransferase (CCA-adding enzyme)